MYAHHSSSKCLVYICLVYKFGIQLQSSNNDVSNYITCSGLVLPLFLGVNNWRSKADCVIFALSTGIASIEVFFTWDTFALGYWIDISIGDDERLEGLVSAMQTAGCESASSFCGCTSESLHAGLFWSVHESGAHALFSHWSLVFPHLQWSPGLGLLFSFSPMIMFPTTLTPLALLVRLIRQQRKNRLEHTLVTVRLNIMTHRYSKLHWSYQSLKSWTLNLCIIPWVYGYTTLWMTWQCCMWCNRLLHFQR